MSALVAKQYRLKLLQKCFLSIKTNLPANEIKESVRTHHRDCFPLVRVCADISQVSKRYFAINRRGLVYCITKYNRKFLSEIRREARSAMSFRLFKSVLRTRTAKRLTVEQRVISESFYARGNGFFPTLSRHTMEFVVPSLSLSFSIAVTITISIVINFIWFYLIIFFLPTSDSLTLRLILSLFFNFL